MQARQPGLFVEDSDLDIPVGGGQPLWVSIEELAARSDRLFVKKLSRNDTSWADDSGKHQAGFYIPRDIREAGFFPELVRCTKKSHIFRAKFDSLWPQTGQFTPTTITHFSNKGHETHFTVPPKELFRGLSPASLLLCGRFRESEAGARYWLVVLDSAGEVAEILETVLDLSSSFGHGLFEPAELRAHADLVRDEAEELIQLLHDARSSSSLDAIVARFSRLPDPTEIAREARSKWMVDNHVATFDPYELAAPGDAIMEISRDVEYRIFRAHEVKRRAAEIVRIMSDYPDPIVAAVRGFPQLDAVFLSASQQRKTRAGRSFEHHISAALTGGRIRFEEQAVTGGRRPDFVIPDARTLRLGANRNWNSALVLAAKTTLRERWKQVSSEGLHCATFLATVDDRVPRSTINELALAGITLVVPESLKMSKVADYQRAEHVITFRDFFVNEIKRKRSLMWTP
jgi:hypothetical protein